MSSTTEPPAYGSPSSNEPGQPTTRQPNWWQRNWRKLTIVGVIITLVGCVIGGGAWLTNKQTWNAGHKTENVLMQHQATVYIRMDQHIKASKIASSASLAERQTATDLIWKAVSGRYTSPDGKDTPAKAALGQGWAISALREQYPKEGLSQDLFKAAIEVAIGTLADMEGAQLNAQNDVKDLRDFATTCVMWCSVHEKFPTDKLVFIDPFTRLPTKKGMDALDHFSVPIMGTKAAGAAQSGILDEDNNFGSTSPSPTVSTSSSPSPSPKP
jgi:hypothetical protein